MNVGGVTFLSLGSFIQSIGPINHPNLFITFFGNLIFLIFVFVVFLPAAIMSVILTSPITIPLVLLGQWGLAELVIQIGLIPGIILWILALVT